MIDVTAPVGALAAGVNGNLADDVRRIQYLFNKTSTGDGGPPTVFDTTSGTCDQVLIDAINAFQQFQLHWSDGTVDPSNTTVTKLNQVADLSAYSRRREEDEFLSWLRRPPQWNYTLEDNLNRTGAGKPFSFAAETLAWLPAAYQQNLVATVSALLDPQQTPAGTWGVGPWDLYHAHVVTVINPSTGAPLNPAVAPIATNIRGLVKKNIDPLTTQQSTSPSTAPADIQAFDAALAPALAPLHDPLQALAAVGDAAILYHSFEFSVLMRDTTRYAGYAPSDPRRNWLTPLLAPVPVMYVSPSHSATTETDFFPIIQLAFLIDKQDQIAVVADTKIELITVTQAPYTEIA